MLVSDRRSALDQLLNLADQKGEIRFGERELGRRDAMVLDIGKDMFVMGMSGGQGRIVRVRPGIVPIEFLFVG
jgi:hypothetical protein